MFFLFNIKIVISCNPCVDKANISYRIILIALITSITITTLTGEYWFKDGRIPSYLFYEFENTKDKALHKEITINLSVSILEGTLLYFIDIKNNQLILSLFEEIEERMKIEWCGVEYYLKLIEFCGCTKCRYQPLEIRLKLNQFINLQCNNGVVKELHMNSDKLINKAYPLIKDGDKFDAYMWLVNTPLGDGYYPNNQQLSGCIYDVSYNKQSLKMQTSSDVGDKCEKKCDGNVCNGGVCHETFGDIPYCDCTNSFMNGPYCNKTEFLVSNNRIKGVKQNIKFQSLKISWRSNSTEIFNFSNMDVSLNAIAKFSNLEIIYEQKNEMKYKTISLITNQYVYSSYSILFLTIESKLIKIKYRNKNETFENIIPTAFDLSNEYFTSMSFLNGNGSIDAMYKINKLDYQWIYIDFNLSKRVLDIDVNQTQNDISRKNNWRDIGYKFLLIALDNEKSKIINESFSQCNEKENNQNKKIITGLIIGLILNISICLILSLVVYKIASKRPKRKPPEKIKSIYEDKKLPLIKNKSLQPM